MSRPTLKSCSFPIHQPGETKNSHEPPTGRNFFFQSLYLKRKTTQRFKKISSQSSKNFTLYISIFNFYVQFLYWFIIIWWCEKLLGINIDCKLSFDDHIGKICKNAGAKLNALTRVAQYIIQKKALNYEWFFSSQLNYCPLTWMFHNGLLNHETNRLHERYICVIYDGHSSYDELLNLDNSVSIHHRNLQILATKMFRVYSGQLLIF